MSFADKMRTARNEKDYSQECLAELIGVSRQTITKWESGTGFPEMKKALLLAATLQVSLDWFFEEELEELGWEPFADGNERILLSAEDESMSKQKVNSSMVKEAMDKLNNPIIKKEMSTGIGPLDAIDDGFHRGSVYYVLGEPEIGKLSFALNIADNFLKRNEKVTIFLKEHTIQSVIQRMVCIDADVACHLFHKEYSSEENDRIKASTEFISKADLTLDDSYDDSIEKIYEKCVNSNQQNDLIIIDSARFLHTSFTGKGNNDREHRITNILSEIAMTCRCAVVVLDRIDNNIADMLITHENPEKVVEEYVKKSILTESDPLMFFHRTDYYEGSKDICSKVDLLFHSGYHRKGTKYISLILNKETGKIDTI